MRETIGEHKANAGDRCAGQAALLAGLVEAL